ncbi:DUF998 domain-containing protein [Streptomyces sp. NPDC048441]|uniref:DUF998 domain-containing protein n=1 Tax=Streptomyces sp. NPDC048441 TaxID=3365552 RepID=UPI00371F9E05
MTQVIVGAAWKGRANTPYSWASNNISDLGNVHCRTWDDSRPRYVCSPMHDVMNVSFAVHGVLLLAGVLLTSAGGLWGAARISRAAQALFAVNAGAWVLVGFVPADVNEDLHVLGAFLIMGIGGIGLILTGFAPRDALLGSLRPISLTIATTAALATWLFFAQQDPGIGLGGMERVTAFAPDALMLVIAITALTRREPATPPTRTPPLGSRH